MSVGTRILSVEDDERIRTAVKLALEDEGWSVEEAETGEEALNSFQRQPADVVLIDIMLPGIDGFDVCRAIRRTSDVPIVMVTARADTHDVVAGLEAGADDYLTKPFAPKELSARIRALLRRARATDATATHLRFGELEIIPDEGVVRRSDEEIHLTKTEYALLEALVTNPGKLLTHQWLLRRVWGPGYANESHYLRVYVRAIRRKLGIEALLLTRAEQGMTLFTARGAMHFKAEAREVFDVSGAGDTVIAALGTMLAAGVRLDQAVRIANRAAGIVVGKLGTAVVHREELFGS